MGYNHPFYPSHIADEAALQYLLKKWIKKSQKTASFVKRPNVFPCFPTTIWFKFRIIYEHSKVFTITYFHTHHTLSDRWNTVSPAKWTLGITGIWAKRPSSVVYAFTVATQWVLQNLTLLGALGHFMLYSQWNKKQRDLECRVLGYKAWHWPFEALWLEKP